MKVLLLLVDGAETFVHKDYKTLNIKRLPLKLSQFSNKLDSSILF